MTNGNDEGLAKVGMVFFGCVGCLVLAVLGALGSWLVLG